MVASQGAGTMPKIDLCDLCHFYANSPFLVCFINPTGVEGGHCEEFCAKQDQSTGASLEWWEPVGASYYGDELVITSVQRLTNQQRLELLDSHPLFTGRCPHCEMPMRQTVPARVHWDCQACGWVDESI
jgi:hypothetical protein